MIFPSLLHLVNECLTCLVVIYKEDNMYIYSLVFNFLFLFCPTQLIFYLLWFQIRTLGMLRSRFQSLPGAFNACLIPEERTETTKKKGLKATFSRKFDLVACFLVPHQYFGLCMHMTIDFYLSDYHPLRFLQARKKRLRGLLSCGTK